MRFVKSTKNILIYQQQKCLPFNYVIWGSDGGHFENHPENQKTEFS